MNKNAEILSYLIDEDVGLKTSPNGRWGKGIEHDSLVVDNERGIFYYNSMGVVGDPLVYLTKVRGMSFPDARDYLRKFNYSGVHVYSIRGDRDEDVVVYPKLVDVFFEDGRREDCRKYLYKRGINDETIDRFQIGWYNNWVMIPFFMDGAFRNFQMRRDEPSKTFKKYYSGVGPLLYNADILKLTDTIFITEGPIDALALIQNGIPAISTDMSGNILPEWYGYFLRQKTIYIVFDNDSAGETEARRVANVLGTLRCKIYTFKDFPDQKGYDPVDFFRDGGSKDDFLERVTTQAKYTYELENEKRRFKNGKG